MICFLVHQGTKKIRRESGEIQWKEKHGNAKKKKHNISGDQLRDKYNLVAPISNLHSNVLKQVYISSQP